MTYIKFADNVGHTVHLRVHLIEPKIMRDIHVYSRPSDENTGEKDAFLSDMFKVERIWLLTGTVEDWHEFDQLNTMLTQTMQQNIPMSLYLGLKSGGGYTYNGMNGLVMDIHGDWDVKKSVVVFKIMFLQGAVHQF